MTLDRYLANRPPAPNPRARPWLLQRRPVEASADVSWETVRGLAGPLGAVREEVLAPAPGEFRPHDLVRLQSDDGEEHYWFVRDDGRVATTRQDLYWHWVRPWLNASEGSLLLIQAQDAGIERRLLVALSARMIRDTVGDNPSDGGRTEAALALFERAGDGAPDPAAVRASLGLGPGEEPDETGSVEEMREAAVLALLLLAQGPGLVGEPARLAARAAAERAGRPGAPNTEYTRAVRARARREALARQEALVREAVPLAALLEAATEEDRP